LFTGRLPSQPVVARTAYLSGVSVQPQIDSVDTWTPLVAAYRKFILDEYGADFEPNCAQQPSEPDAQKWIKSVASGSIRLPGEPTVVATGWTWKPSAADTTVKPRRADPAALQR
jgi:hypothetical protein